MSKRTLHCREEEGVEFTVRARASSSSCSDRSRACSRSQQAYASNVRNVRLKLTPRTLKSSSALLWFLDCPLLLSLLKSRPHHAQPQMICDTNGSLETGRERMGNAGRETASYTYHLTCLAQLEVFTDDRLSAVLCIMRPFGGLFFDFLDNEFQ